MSRWYRAQKRLDRATAHYKAKPSKRNYKRLRNALARYAKSPH